MAGRPKIGSDVDIANKILREKTSKALKKDQAQAKAFFTRGGLLTNSQFMHDYLGSSFWEIAFSFAFTDTFRSLQTEIGEVVRSGSYYINNRGIYRGKLLC